MLNIENKFITDLPQDKVLENYPRQVENACFSYVTPKIPKNPKLIHLSDETASLLGFSEEFTQSDEFLNIVSGKTVYPNTKPYAMCYGGHQFGHWAGQLGDGRAINLFEIQTKENQSYTLQLKGAGKTPYSRTADGLAVLRSSIREHLCSEAMFHLGIPTTRSLSLCLSGDEVLRDVMYDGNADYEKGAIVCRVAPTFIRFGNFEILSARSDFENLKKLTDFTIKNYYQTDELPINKYISFFEEVANKTLNLIIDWQRVGFVHGVMNTDNMSILGQTIDYGPYGWLEDYNPDWTPNTTDAQHHRYAFGNQPEIALWNLYQLANSLFPLVNDAKPFEKVLNDFKENYEERYIAMMSSKLGFSESKFEDKKLIKELEKILQKTETDYIIFFREIANIKKEKSAGSAITSIINAFYNPSELNKKMLLDWEKWVTKYLLRLQKEKTSDEKRKEKMNLINPKYVLRNYMAQLAIEKAENEDYTLINELYNLLKKPYDEQHENEKWYAKRPDWAREKVGCSMLSCSS